MLGSVLWRREGPGPDTGLARESLSIVFNDSM